MELNSRNLRSQCEAVIVVLQGLMSSKGGTSAGCVTRVCDRRGDRSGNSHDLSAKSHECYRI